MKYNLPCEIVKDLLPSYLDELTSETSSQAVKEHLETCETCRNVYKAMSGNELAADQTSDDFEKAEIDFLKKNRSLGRKKVLGAVLGTLAVILLAFGYKHFIAASPCDPSILNYELCVSNEDITISGNIIDGYQGVRSVDYTMVDGRLNIEIKSTGASPIFRNSFVSSYLPEEDVKEVTINGQVIAWSDGEYIAPKVSDIFTKKNSYIGDISADQALAEAIGLPELIGSYTNELDTENEPYGWTMISDDTFSKEEAALVEERIKPYATILLATIDNLGYFQWNYNCDGKDQSLKMTLEDAKEYIASSQESSADPITCESVKDFGASAGALQRLIELLPIHDYRFSSGNLGLYLGGDMEFNLINQTDAEIYSIGYSFYVNSECIVSGSTSNADGSKITQGELGSMGIPAENDIKDPDQDKISIKANVMDKNGNVFETQLIDLGTLNQMKETYADDYKGKTGLFTFDCIITGNEADGFSLTIQ